MCRFHFSFIPNVAPPLPQAAGCLELDSCASAYYTAWVANLETDQQPAVSMSGLEILDQPGRNFEIISLSWGN